MPKRKHSKIKFIAFSYLGLITLLTMPANSVKADQTVNVPAQISVGPGALYNSQTEVSMDYSGVGTGTGRSVDADMNFVVNDATQSTAGWSITVTSTAYVSTTDSSKAASFSSSATSSQAAATFTCLDGYPCVTAQNGDSLLYPFYMPQATGATDAAPLANKVFEANGSTGLLAQQAAIRFYLAVPDNLDNDSYMSNCTVSLITGP